MVRIAESLVTPYHAFAILSGTAFTAAILWPASPADPLGMLIRGPLLPITVGLLIGFLGLQVGEVERGYGPYSPGQRAGRLGALVGFGLALVLPFLFIHRVERGLPWIPFAGIVTFLYAYGLFWALVGLGLAAAVHSDGLRFVVKYGSYCACAFALALPGLPASPLTALGALWRGMGSGWWGLVLYGALDLGAMGAWLWAKRGSSAK